MEQRNWPRSQKELQGTPIQVRVASVEQIFNAMDPTPLEERSLNPEVDRLFVEGRTEVDRAKRAEKYARIQELLWEDQPYTWLYWRNSFHGFSKNVRGYVFSPRGPFHYSPGFGSLWTPVP